MFDWLVDTIITYPYVGVAVVFVLCGMGLPLPEEIVLIAGGYVCHQVPDRASVPWMMVWCGGAILLGDAIPFVLGRIFGTRLLRLRYLRMLVTRRRLAKFDHWFRRRGDLVIFIARFLAGIRVVAFFTAGTMRMPWRRFLLLDGLGIVILAPPLIWLGYSGGEFIDSVIETVQRAERSLLITTLAVAVAFGLYVLLWRRKRRPPRRGPADTYVEPRVQPRADWEGPPPPPELEVGGHCAQGDSPPSTGTSEPPSGGVSEGPRDPNISNAQNRA